VSDSDVSEVQQRLTQPGIAYLLSVLGTESSRRWRRRMEALGVDPREVVVLRMVAVEPGRSQSSLAPALQVRATHLVAVIDGLERKRLLQRRSNPADRRANALWLTAKGKRLLDRAMRESISHEHDLVQPIPSADRVDLEQMLRRMAAALNVAEGGHPGFDEGD
jgi:DNA-binding MarR family transcriptional regulator